MECEVRTGLGRVTLLAAPNFTNRPGVTRYSGAVIELQRRAAAEHSLCNVHEICR